VSIISTRITVLDCTHYFFRSFQVGTNYRLILYNYGSSEASGIVEAVGEDVSHLKVGDRVAYFSPSTYAEYTCANSSTTARVPDSISMEDAAVANLAGITALMLCQEIYKVRKGDYVLVHAAAGGVGQTLCQICSSLGAIVVGTTSTAAKAEIASKSGAHHLINYTTQNVTDEVMRITDGNGCRVVFDGVGKSTFDSSLACVAKRGYLLCFGNASGKPDPFDITRLTKGSKVLCRPTMGDFISTPEDYQRRITLYVF
jgi:NADPH:quinone reductase